MFQARRETHGGTRLGVRFPALGPGSSASYSSTVPLSACRSNPFPCAASTWTSQSCRSISRPNRWPR